MAKITIEELSGSLKEYLNGLGLTEAQVQELIDKFEDEKIGDISQLSTENKTNIVTAINELFQNANNGKELIANAIGEPLDSNDTFNAMSNDINGLLSTFKTNMMNNGVTVNSSDKFKALIDKIATIADNEGKGILYKTGKLNDLNFKAGASTSETITLNVNFEFTPNIVFIEGKTIGNIYGENNIPVLLGKDVDVIINNQLQAFLTITSYNSTSITFKFSRHTNEMGTGVRNLIYHAIGVGEEDTTLRDSLASILEDEGVSVTEEDDMASLISKVDEEFDRQVVPVGTAVASNVLSGKTFINSTGQTITGTMANRGGAQTVTPGTSNKTLNSGYYSGNITVKGDNNLKPENIVSGKSIFGISGTAATSKMQSGTISYSSTSGTVNVTMDLDFTPTYVFVVLTSTPINSSGLYAKNLLISNLSGTTKFGSNTNYNYEITDISSTGFILTCGTEVAFGGGTITGTWYAIS